ncbi:MAG: hypothetical protein ACOYVK_19750 [Bacillota bacterium]
MQQFECLDNFPKRMKFIAPIYSIAEKLGRNARYNEFDMMNITFSVLCYLQYVTLTQESGCYLEDVGEFIQDMIVTFYEVDITDELATEIADYIIREILQGKGSMLTADILNIEKRCVDTYTFILVDNNLKLSKTEKKNRYKLTHEAMEILFRTDEVDSVMLMNLKTLILKKAIQGSNYDKAIKEITELLNICKVLYSKVESMLNQMKVRVYEISLKEVEELQESLNQQFDEQFEKFNNLLSIVDTRKKEIHTQLTYNEEKKLEEDIRKLDMIKANLNLIINEYSKLLNIKQDIYTTYKKELLLAIESGYKSGLDFNRIKSEFENNTLSSEKIISLFKPLLKIYTKRRFNLESIFQPQNLYFEILVDEEKMDNTILNNDQLTELESAIDIEKTNSIYESGLSLLLEEILKSKGFEITLKDFVERTKQKSKVDYQEILLERDFYEMLIVIYRGENSLLDIKECYELSLKYIEKPSLNFNPIHVIGKVIKESHNFKDLKSIRIDKYGDTIISIEDKFRISDLTIKVGV